MINTHLFIQIAKLLESRSNNIKLYFLSFSILSFSLAKLAKLEKALDTKSKFWTPQQVQWLVWFYSLKFWKHVVICLCWNEKFEAHRKKQKNKKTKQNWRWLHNYHLVTMAVILDILSILEFREYFLAQIGLTRCFNYMKTSFLLTLGKKPL